MDIITYIIENIGIFSVVAGIMTAGFVAIIAITYGLMEYRQRQAKKWKLAHLRKMAGIASDNESAYLRTTKKPKTVLRKRKVSKPKQKFSWKSFVENIKEKKDNLKKLHPMYNINEQLKKLEKQVSDNQRNTSNRMWGLGDRIDRIDELVKPKKAEKKIPPPRKKKPGENNVQTLQSSVPDIMNSKAVSSFE